MVPFTDEPTAHTGGTAPSIEGDLPRPAARAGSSLDWRKLTLPVSLLAVPAATGVLYARARTRRRGLFAAGLAAIGLGALRVELARWFASEPAFHSDGKVGDLELRRYDARIEACTRVDDLALEAAIDHGYGRLAGYICGANQAGEILARTTPTFTAMREGCYTVSWVMPPGRTLEDLPRPDHPGVELRKVPAREIAALRFRGRCTRDNTAAHERVLLRQLADAELSACDGIVFATFDAPATLPILRRNELWVEIV